MNTLHLRDVQTEKARHADNPACKTREESADGRSAWLRRLGRRLTGRMDALDGESYPVRFRFKKLRRSLRRSKNHQQRNNRRLALNCQSQFVFRSRMVGMTIIGFGCGNVRVAVIVVVTV